jgi:hypothetical protein
MDILNLAMGLPRSTRRNSSDGVDVNGQKFGFVEYKTETGKAILSAKDYTSSPEVYDYLTSALIPFQGIEPFAYYALRKHAYLGNVSMVRHLLQLGVPVQKSGGCDTPLVMACRGLHHDIVDILLESGADPNFAAEGVVPTFPLHESATGGSLSLARKLLDHGALPNRVDDRPGRYLALWWAFA